MHQPRAHRPHPRGAPAATRRHRVRRRPPRPRPPLLDRHRPRWRRSAGGRSASCDEALEATVAWYRDNRWWWEPLKAPRPSCGSSSPAPAASSAATSSPPASRPATRWLAADHATLDVTDRDAVLGAVAATRPDAVVHAAAWTAVDACEADPDRAYVGQRARPRDASPRPLDASGAHLVHLSTDYVFDGDQARRRTPSGTSRARSRSTAARSSPASGRPSPAPRRHHRAHVVGVRRPRRQHGEDRAAAGRRARPTLSFVDDQRGPPDVHRRPRADAAPPGRRPPAPASTTSPTRAR